LIFINHNQIEFESPAVESVIIAAAYIVDSEFIFVAYEEA